MFVCFNRFFRRRADGWQTVADARAERRDVENARLEQAFFTDSKISGGFRFDRAHVSSGNAVRSAARDVRYRPPE